MTGIIAMPHFNDVFGVQDDVYKKSLVMSLYNVYARIPLPPRLRGLLLIMSYHSGTIVCSPFAAILSDKYGRRTT